MPLSADAPSEKASCDRQETACASTSSVAASAPVVSSAVRASRHRSLQTDFRYGFKRLPPDMIGLTEVVFAGGCKLFLQKKKIQDRLTPVLSLPMTS